MKTCCFTGHRPDKLGGYDWRSRKNIEIGKKLKDCVLRLVENDVDTFIFGGAIGVDQMAFAVVSKLKKQMNLNINLIVATPFKNQFVKWTKENKERYFSQLDEADSIIYCDELVGEKYYCELGGVGNYHPAKMQKRNEYMVDNSDYVVAVWWISSGGTCNCVNYALKKNKDIIYINPAKIIIKDFKIEFYRPK